MSESKPNQPFRESAYPIPTGSAFNKPSAEIVSLVETLPKGASVLDLGCGEGRNALFLAERGFAVTAVDASSHRIGKLGKLAAQGGLTVRAEAADLREYQPDREFDLIISHGCLHLMERAGWQQVLQRIQSCTRRGGYNVVAVFTDRLRPPPDLEAFCIGLFCDGELFTYYADWEIELQQSYVVHNEHPGGLKHSHPIDKIVARKPVQPGETFQNER